MTQVVPPPATDKEALLAGLLRVGDAAWTAASGYLAHGVWIGFFPISSNYLLSFFLASLLTLNGMTLAGAYRAERVRRPLRRFGRALASWGMVAASLALLSVILKTTDSYSRVWFFVWLVLGGVGLFLLRLGVALLVARWRETGQALKRVILVGDGARLAALARHLQEVEGPDLSIVGSVALSGGLQPVGRTAGGRCGDLTDLPDLVRQEHAEEVIVAAGREDAAALRRLLPLLRRLPVTVRLTLEPPDIDLPLRGVSEIGGLPMLDIWRRPLSRFDLAVKAAEDRVLATLLLLAAAPVMLLIALLIKLDSPGPLLFRQQRAGFSNDTFEMLKFRTMQQEAASVARVPQARRNDPRVTRVGAFLRRSSLDELPQLLNVLRGEMSLVGPRPHALAHDQHFAALIDDYLARQRVKPGMTGWAQVNGLRGETDTPEKMRRRVQYDLHYIDSWSVFFDLKILVLTLFVGFVHRNAY